jgi:signal peptidase II
LNSVNPNAPHSLRSGRARRRLATPLLLALLVVLADQVSKWAVIRELGPTRDDHRTELLSSVLALHYVENSGAAFGFLRGQSLLLTVVAAAVVVSLVFSYQRMQHATWQLTAGLGLLLGGAIGNLVDRIRLGYVVDFVEVSAWPKFNIADSAITIGVIFIAWHALVHDQMTGSDSLKAAVSRPALDRDGAP